jgi:ParB family chromosome partitioning protein
MIHQLKTEKQFFEDILSGDKSFELRHNDRMFQVGDFLAMNEIQLTEGEGIKYTGRCCMVEVTYVIQDNRFLQDGFVALGIRPCSIATISESMMMHNRNLYAVQVYGQ